MTVPQETETLSARRAGMAFKPERNIRVATSRKKKKNGFDQVFMEGRGLKLASYYNSFQLHHIKKGKWTS